MPCVQTQYGTLPYENTYFSSEFLNPDLTAKLVMDLSSQTEQLSASSLPSINTLVGDYTGEFDAFACQIPAAASSSSAQGGAEASSPHDHQSPLKLDDLQVYGCYPGTFALSYLDETLSSCGSDYYGSPLSAAASPPTPGYQTQQVSAWDSPFTSYSPGPACWVSDKPGLPQAASFFTFNATVEQPSPLDAAQPSLGEEDPFSQPPQQQHQHQHAGSPSQPFGHLALEQGSLDNSVLMEGPHPSPKTRSPTSSEGRCAVCGDNASCQHYGVRTCEGCKGFFKVGCLQIIFCLCHIFHYKHTVFGLHFLRAVLIVNAKSPVIGNHQ